MTESRQKLCPLCHRPISVGTTRCPWCSGTMGPPEGIDIFLRRIYFSPPTIILIVALCAALGFVLYRNIALRNDKIYVTTGTMKHCPVNDEDYDVLVKRIAVPKEEADNYRVEVTETCPPDVLEAAGMLDPKRAGVQVDVNLTVRDPRVSELLKEYPDWDPTVAWYVSRGELAPGMNKRQVVAGWGEPVVKDRVARGAQIYERWQYGDPLYGIPLQRYTLFKDGLLADFYENPTLKKLYGEIIEEHRAAMRAKSAPGGADDGSVILKMFR